MANLVNNYLKSIEGVFHTTFNPKDPGVVRVHLVPPKKLKMGIPWAVILNGYDILPLNTSWAILLIEFIKVVNKKDGKEISNEELSEMVKEIITNVKKVFPKTDTKILLNDLNDIIDTLKDIAHGKKPNQKIGYYTLDKYARYMNAPHRMDLMISAMTKDGHFNCNQKCLHCYAGKQHYANTIELKTSEWCTIIDKCHDAGIPSITFTGGEPTMRDDLVELVDYSKWFVTRLNTNGIRLTIDLCEALYEASLDSVQVTVYSSNPDIHNKMVGGNHFNETIQGIKNALNAGLNVSVNTPICTANADYTETIKFLHDLGVRYFSCSGLILTGNARNADSSIMRLSKDELYETILKAVTYARQNDLDINFTSPGQISVKNLKELGLIIPSCGACLSNMAIAPNGDVVPCQSWLSDDSLGNLVKESWKSIWNAPRTKELRLTSSKLSKVCPLTKNTLMEERKDEN